MEKETAPSGDADNASRARNDAKKPLWKRAARWTYDHLLLPGTWKEVGIYLASWLVVWPLLGAAVFPRAEKVVAGQGLDPKVVSELAPGKRIYVRTDNMLGKAHALLDRGPLGIPLNWWESLRRGSEGGHARAGRLSSNNFGTCMVYLHTSEYKNQPPEIYQQALLHEIRHCSEDNVKMSRYGIFDNVSTEGDADAKSIEALARLKNQPGLKQRFLDERAMNGNPGDRLHNDALYLDAIFNHRAVPTSAAIDAANAEAEPVRLPLMHREISLSLSAAAEKLGMPSACKTVPSFKQDCAYDLSSAHLSPLAQRRAELMDEAFKRNITINIKDTPAKPDKPHKAAPKKPAA